MDYLHLINSDDTESIKDMDANFGMDVPRKGDWLTAPTKLKKPTEYIVIKVEHRFREDGSGKVMVQYDRHVWAREAVSEDSQRKPD